MKEIMINLLPCPFCGYPAAFYVTDHNGICVKCTSCNCQTPYADDDTTRQWSGNSAIDVVTEVWNTRVAKEGV